jgi:hypothetical protein
MPFQALPATSIKYHRLNIAVNASVMAAVKFIVPPSS